MRDVNVIDIRSQPSFSAEVLSAPQLLPPLPQLQDFLLSIHVPAFGVAMAGEITDMHINNGYREVIFESVVDSGVFALLTLRNEQSNGAGEDLQIMEASLSFKVKDHKPRTHFIADSLYAMLGLAGPLTISIPNMNIELGLNFRIAASEVSKFLQLRQTEFALMVLEAATGLEFEVPDYISGDEMNSISLAYHAIVMHQFVWRVNEIIQPTPATEEMLAWLDSLRSTGAKDCTYQLMFGPSAVTRPILGRDVMLGDETVFIDDGIIEDFDSVRRELAQNDGHIVPIRIIPRGRKGRYVFSHTPRLPEAPWDEKIESFIMLENSLNERLAAHYHQLAASTLANLTTQEIELVIAKPEVGQDAYLIRD